MPITVEGMQTFKISPSFIPLADTTVSNAAVAAETGLAVIPMWEAITLILIARSGRILFLMAISAMMGIIE